MPYKPCPKCQNPNGVRTLKCACGFEFRKKKPYKKTASHKNGVVPRKKKIVSHKKKAVSHKKSVTTHKKKNIVKQKSAVKKSLPKKNTKKPLKKPLPVLSKLEPKTKKSVVWTDLENGDRVRVFKDSGPRMILSDGVEICIGHYGVFTVHRLDLYGIHAYGKNGYAFLWMGSDEFSKLTGIKRIKHKIKRLSNAKTVK